MPTRPEVGILDENILPDHFYMTDIMHCMNSNARKVTSYKYAFFKCILDNLFNATLEADGYYYLKFKFLSYSFSKIYWNLSAKHGEAVPQINNGQKMLYMTEQCLKLRNDPKLHLGDADFDVINQKIRDKYLKATASQIEKDVMWALYSDFNCHIYGYNRKEKYIYFSARSYQFLSDYKDALEKIDFYAWIKWTENILDISHRSIDNLSKKLDEEPERKALERFKRELLGKGDDYVCFYCGKSLAGDRSHLDHFIPWSFIKNNPLWNFVFSCASCNEHKNNKIPSEIYLEKIIERNKKLFGESYENNLRKSYDAALHNGFNKWEK